jgi:hypothetical protein
VRREEGKFKDLINATRMLCETEAVRSGLLRFRRCNDVATRSLVHEKRRRKYYANRKFNHIMRKVSNFTFTNFYLFLKSHHFRSRSQILQ